MKKIILAVLSAVLTCLSLNAQTANTGLVARAGHIFQGDTKLTSDQVHALLGDTMYENDYAPARNMCVAGNVTMIIGGTAVVGGGVALLCILNNKEKPTIGSTLVDIMGATASAGAIAVGAVGVVAGGIVRAVGCKRVKEVVSVTNTGGLAIAF